MFQWDVRALEILDALEQAGHQAVLVGGCVRDALLGREPHDYDAWPPAVQSSNASPPAWPTGRSPWSTAASRWR